MNRTPWITSTDDLQPWRLPAPEWTCYSLYSQIEMLEEGFDPISLEAMDGVALLNRVDTKFVMTTGQLLTALTRLQPVYWMLEVNGRRMNHYRTLYFDTTRFDMYHDHVNGRAERYKVRSREYIDSQLSFLEVKHHTRKDRTIKDRMRTRQPATEVSASMGDWLRSVSPLNPPSLEPKLWNMFTRMTLVSQQFCERVTLDVDLAFSAGDRLMQLDGIAVAEVKMDSAGCCSPFLAQMRSQRIRARGFSKYAIGTALMYDRVKKNALKPKILWVEKTMKGQVCDD